MESTRARRSVVTRQVDWMEFAIEPPWNVVWNSMQLRLFSNEIPYNDRRPQIHRFVRSARYDDMNQEARYHLHPPSTHMEVHSLSAGYKVATVVCFAPNQTMCLDRS